MDDRSWLFSFCHWLAAGKQMLWTPARTYKLGMRRPAQGRVVAEEGDQWTCSTKVGSTELRVLLYQSAANRPSSSGCCSLVHPALPSRLLPQLDNRSATSKGSSARRRTNPSQRRGSASRAAISSPSATPTAPSESHRFQPELRP